MPAVQNKTFDEISLGDTASAQRSLQCRDIRAWAAVLYADALARDPAGILPEPTE